MRLRRPVAIAFLAAAAAVTGSCARGEARFDTRPASPEPPGIPIIRLTTGLAAAGPANRSLGAALVEEYERLPDGGGLELLESVGGAVDTLEALQRGSTDCGVSLADVSYLAYAGLLEERPGRHDDLRGVAVLDVAPIHLLIRGGSGIRDVADLAGRVVAVGPVGSESRVAARLVLHAFGVPERSVRAETLGFDVAAAALNRGRVDAMFFTAAAPADLVQSAIEGGARLLPLQGAPVQVLLSQYPFLRFARIHGGLYPHHEQPTRTIGVEKVLLCRSGLSDARVYELTRHLFAVLPRVAAAAGHEWFSALEHAPATPVPLHPGAARFYRARELFP